MILLFGCDTIMYMKAALDITQLYSLIHLPQEVVKEAEIYRMKNTNISDASLKRRLTDPSAWDGAIEEIKARIGEDPYGFGMLVELLRAACETYDRYMALGIPEKIFVRTMEFCTRFIERNKEIHGYYAFLWGWWFPRQLAMREFRIEALEFEFTEQEKKRIFIHIPSDADMRPISVQKTFDAFRDFLHRYYPAWENADWYCDSWMLSPALDKLLDKTSNILAFQRLFEVESWDPESMAVLDWVYPMDSGDAEALSTGTSLQKKMKAFLLDGGKVGWAKGKYKNR